jgi:hypothetical protein
MSMSEQTPSQAEGERDDDVTGTYDPPRTTPSQAEGERTDDVEDVTQAPPGEGADRQAGYARARDDEEPGAHSGQESQARERVVPGTASAAEGYGASGGTASGEPLTGVEEPADERNR